ncbi:hypothetical protein ACLB2K_051168 [Fragaria x ananassa]
MSVSLQSPPSSAISSSLHFQGRKLSLFNGSSLLFTSRPSLPLLRASALDTGSATELDAVSSFSEIVPDTVIFDDFERFPPTAATVSSALLLGICSLPDTIFRNAVDMALADSECNKHENSELRLSCFFNKALVNVGADLAKLVPGRVSTEVDARLAYDTHGIIRKGNVDNLVIFGPLRDEDFDHFFFSFAQAAAAAQAGAAVIQIFVGRLRDWSRNHSGDPEIEAALKRGEDPGLALVTKTYNYIHKYGHKSKLIAAAVRNKQDLFSLLGVDYIIAPLKLIKWDQLTFASAVGPAAVELLAGGLDGYASQANRVEELFGKLWPPPNV